MSDLPGLDHSCLTEVIITWWELTSAQIGQNLNKCYYSFFFNRILQGKKTAKIQLIFFNINGSCIFSMEGLGKFWDNKGKG